MTLGADVKKLSVWLETNFVGSAAVATRPVLATRHHIIMRNNPII